MRPGFDPWLGKISWKRAWQPTPVSLPAESHGQRRLAGCSLRSRKESDTTERLTGTKMPPPPRPPFSPLFSTIERRPLNLSGLDTSLLTPQMEVTCASKWYSLRTWGSWGVCIPRTEPGAALSPFLSPSTHLSAWGGDSAAGDGVNARISSTAAKWRPQEEPRSSGWPRGGPGHGSPAWMSLACSRTVECPLPSPFLESQAMTLRGKFHPFTAPVLTLLRSESLQQSPCPPATSSESFSHL